MGHKLIIATLFTASQEAREKFLAKLTVVSKNAQESETGTLKYATFVPRDENDDKTIWVVEEYVDQAAFDLHMNKQEVKDLIQYLKDQEILIGEPNIRELEVIDGMDLTRADVDQCADPYIAFAELDYRTGAVPQSIPYWKEVVATSREESGTLVYGLHKDPLQPDKLFTLEVYESKTYLWDVHAKSNAVAENVKHTKDLRKGLKHSFLKLRSGFLSQS